jgi:hypothetical protein
VVAALVSVVWFVLTRDLVALIVAHVIVDANAFIVAPLRTRRGAHAT